MEHPPLGEEDRASGGGGGELGILLEYYRINGPLIERYIAPRHPYRLAALGTSPKGGSLYYDVFP